MMLRRITIFLFAAIVLASCASFQGPETRAPACTGNASPAAEEVSAARAAFNQAIADEDINAITGLLAPDVILVTGTDSTLFNGRDEQVLIWREDFAAADRTIYIRATECVSVSPIFPIAFETGIWRGGHTDDNQSFASGVYSAKWRNADGGWQLEAEIFSTEECGGSFCPADTAP